MAKHLKHARGRRTARIVVVAVALLAAMSFAQTAQAAFSFSSETIGVSTVQSAATTQQTLTSADKIDVSSVSTVGSSAQLAVPAERVMNDADSAEAAAIIEQQQQDTQAAQTDQTTATTTGGTTKVNAPVPSNVVSAIDGFLAGTPLAGYGSTFVAAANAYGLDPRLLPAIASVESSCGAACFMPYNAWGYYTSEEWSSWDEAIWSMAGHISRGYGSDATPESMEGRYCAAPWGSSVRSRMDAMS